jgi:hypothetical protein
MFSPGCNSIAWPEKGGALLAALALLCLSAAKMPAQSAVSVALESNHPGAVVPADFSGLSFETQAVLPKKEAGYYFRPDNRALIDLFHTLGLKSLRIGGNTSDNPAVKIPAEADIDHLFAFARAAGVKVIYTLRLREGAPSADARIAKYVLDHYASNLACFAVGNEPNMYTKTYPAYHDLWLKFMAAVTAPGMAPSAIFCGPSTTPGKGTWAADFARDFASTGRLAFIGQHSYPCGSGSKVTDAAAGRGKLLAADLPDAYMHFYQSFAPGVQASGRPYRLEETNNFYNGGAKDVSDTFASALWGLDYMWWWAAHGAAGLNFHTGDKVAAADASAPCRYAVFLTSAAGYAVHPLGYAMKAFDLGSHGRLVPMRVTANGDQLNLTAYGVLAPDGALYVTIINKEHGAGAHDATVTLAPGGAYARGEAIFLTAPGDEVAAKTGLLLGGAPIKDDAGWAGIWTPLAAPAADGAFVIEVSAGTATVIKLIAH